MGGRTHGKGQQPPPLQPQQWRPGRPPPAEGPGEGGGRPPRGPGRGPPAPPWATAAAVEPGGQGGRDTSGYYTKPHQKIIQSPDRLYKTLKRLYKDLEY